MQTEAIDSAVDEVTKAPEQPDLAQDAQAQTEAENGKAEFVAESFLCAVSADLFRRAWPSRSTDSNRFNLLGVHIEPCADGGAILVATDGHIVTVLRDADAYIQGRATIRLNDLMIRACKPNKADLPSTERVLLIRNDLDTLPVAIVAHVGDADSDLSRDNAFAWLDEPNSQTIAVEYGDFTINQYFPDWRRVVPTDVEPGTSNACINAVKLKPIIEALKPHHGKECALSLFTATRDPETSPILIKPDPHTVLVKDGLLDGFAVIMPRRQETQPGLPDWVTA